MIDDNYKFFELDFDDVNVVYGTFESFKPEKWQIDFKNDLAKMLLSFASNDLNEEFINENTLEAHYKKHCLAEIPDRNSSRTNIFYDFNTLRSYRKYEDRLTNIYKTMWDDKTHVRIFSLYLVDKINKAFRRLFEGNYYILFTTGCELYNNKGGIAVGIHSFANDFTTNYKTGNTLDYSVFGLSNTFQLKTLSLQALDTTQLEHTFNNLVEKYCKYINIPAFKINR